MEGREKELGPYFILRWAHWILKFCCIAAHCITVQTQERVQHTALHDSTVRTRYLHSIRHLALYNIIRHFGVHVKLFLSTDTYSKTSFWKKATTFQRCTDTNHTKDPAPSRKKNVCHRDKRHKTHTRTMKRTSIKLLYKYLYVYILYILYISVVDVCICLFKKKKRESWTKLLPTVVEIAKNQLTCVFFHRSILSGICLPKSPLKKHHWLEEKKDNPSKMVSLFFVISYISSWMIMIFAGSFFKKFHIHVCYIII